jgi:hypothetical protein
MSMITATRLEEVPLMQLINIKLLTEFFVKQP